MLITELETLKTTVLSEINTLEPLEAADYYDGKTQAINHVINRARRIADNGELSNSDLTILNQFCADQRAFALTSSEALYKGMADGYEAIRLAILASVQN